jgi:hypothetical protein
VRRRSRRFRLEDWFERDITFDPTVGSPSNFYRSFRKPFSFLVNVEMLLGESEVSSLGTIVPVRQGHNF